MKQLPPSSGVTTFNLFLRGKFLPIKKSMAILTTLNMAPKKEENDKICGMRCATKNPHAPNAHGGNAADAQVPKHTEKAREHATPPVGQSESESSPRGAACENDDECDDVYNMSAMMLWCYDDAMTINDSANGVALERAPGGSLDSPHNRIGHSRSG